MRQPLQLQSACVRASSRPEPFQQEETLHPARRLEVTKAGDLIIVDSANITHWSSQSACPEAVPEDGYGSSGDGSAGSSFGYCVQDWGEVKGGLGCTAAGCTALPPAPLPAAPLPLAALVVMAARGNPAPLPPRW